MKTIEAITSIELSVLKQYPEESKDIVSRRLIEALLTKAIEVNCFEIEEAKNVPKSPDEYRSPRVEYTMTAYIMSEKIIRLAVEALKQIESLGGYPVRPQVQRVIELLTKDVD